jgi:hypothetical protein
MLGKNRFERKIHGSDNVAETMRLAEVWTNGNSLRFMNSAPLGCEDRILNRLKDQLGAEPPFLSDFVVDSGASLELHGLRQTGDIDHVCIGDHTKNMLMVGDCHNDEYADLGISTSELVRDPRKHLRWGGYKFSTLESEFIRLRLAGEEKSVRDLSVVLVGLTQQKNQVYFDSDRAAKAAKWQSKSLVQIRVDSLLSKLHPKARGLVATLAAAVRRK